MAAQYMYFCAKDRALFIVDYCDPLHIVMDTCAACGVSNAAPVPPCSPELTGEALQPGQLWQWLSVTDTGVLVSAHVSSRLNCMKNWSSIKDWSCPVIINMFDRELVDLQQISRNARIQCLQVDDHGGYSCTLLRI